MKRCFSAIIAVSFLMLGAGQAGASTITLDATNRGWYQPDGTANGSSSGNNYIAGDCRGPVCSGTSDDLRDWFKFDLSSVSGTVLSAQLLLDVPAGNGFASTGGGTETYVLFDIAGGNVGSLGSNSAAIWADLGTGNLYGFHIGSGADLGTTVATALNGNGLAAITAALGGTFALGGAVGSVNGVVDDEYIFGYTNSDYKSRLQITTEDAAAVPEPTSLLLLGAGGLGLAAKLRRRKHNAQA
jgi:hypothetical protein